MGICRDFGYSLDNLNFFEPWLRPNRWTDRKADRHSLTTRPCCCLPPSRPGLGVRSLGEGRGQYEARAGISEGGGHRL